jgi:transposase
MPRFIEGQDRQQVTLMPECLDDFIADDNAVRVIDAFVGELDLAKLDHVKLAGAERTHYAQDRHCHLISAVNVRPFVPAFRFSEYLCHNGPV